METIILNNVSNLKLHDPVLHKNVCVIPISSSIPQIKNYITLKEALEKNYLKITEVTSGGSVPELSAENISDIPVLVLDGEELKGAKQNRILNTTILIMEKSSLIIPVSCTEQGRWSYNSDSFSDSDYIVAKQIREKKSSSVAFFRKIHDDYRSDQSEVWDEVDKYSRMSKFKSKTNSMRDVTESKKEDFNEYLKYFPCIENQRGIIVFVNGEIAGLDYLSLNPAYKNLHEKLLKSYIFDAFFEYKEVKEVNYEKRTIEFLEEINHSGGEKYKSPGYGFDYRYEGNNIVGSALIDEEEVIHMAFFRTEGKKDEKTMSNINERINYRRKRGSEK